MSERFRILIREASEEEKPLAWMHGECWGTGWVAQGWKYSTVHIQRRKMVWDEQASHFRKLVITFSFALRAVSLKLMGYSFIMEIDINKEVYGFRWSTGPELKSRYCLCCRRQAEVCQAAGSLWGSREAVCQLEWGWPPVCSLIPCRTSDRTVCCSVPSLGWRQEASDMLVSELWCTQTMVPAAKGYLCCWGAGVTCRMGLCHSKAEQGFLHVHSCFCKLGTGENAFSRERSWYIH